jgi:hypothetical protein
MKKLTKTQRADVSRLVKAFKELEALMPKVEKLADKFGEMATSLDDKEDRTQKEDEMVEYLYDAESALNDAFSDLENLDELNASAFKDAWKFLDKKI